MKPRNLLLPQLMLSLSIVSANKEILDIITEYCVFIEGANLLYRNHEYHHNTNQSNLSGGFGSIYFFQCLNPSAGVPRGLAVKKPKADDESTVASYDQEVKFWNKVHSKNPAYLYTHDAKASQLMIMPKIRGKDLADLQLNLIDTPSKIEIFLSLAIQLKKMHDRGVCHNDIHTKNIKVNIDYKNQNVTARFIDFGQASTYTPRDGNLDIYTLCIIGQYLFQNEQKIEIVNVINEAIAKGFYHSHSLDLIIETAVRAEANKARNIGMVKKR